MPSKEHITKLFELLGTNMMSREATAELARYPALRTEVQEVAPGEGIPVRYLTSERDGLLMKLSSDGEILTIFLMSEGKDGFSQYRGELPGGLTFQSQPGDVLKKLGAPAFNRAPGKVGPFETGELLRFDWPTHSVHFQFRHDRSGIELVSAMTAASVPGRSVAKGSHEQ